MFNNNSEFEQFLKSLGISFANNDECEYECGCDSRNGESRHSEPQVYGFRMTVGSDGIPHVQEFGNSKPRFGKTNHGFHPEMQIPAIDNKRQNSKSNANIEIFENATENGGKIVAEMPGLSKEDFKITTRGEKLFINATSKSSDRVYNQNVLLPMHVDKKSIKASYKNGILELVFEYDKDQIKSNINVE